ncbi:MAG: D-glycerate dehydrogenase [SAR324 cluster bacterium]|nr:D-glycerate dehydrogenase [SAR324 cluster bacterium]
MTNDKMTVWITRKLSRATEDRAERDYKVILNPEDRVYSARELIEGSRHCDAILPCHSEKFTREVVAKLSDRVKIVANHSVGVDHCDLDAFEERGIMVTNTPDVLSDATAELTFMLLLCAARRAGEGERLVRSGNWDSWGPNLMVGKQTTNKRLGIVGLGRVGQVVAKRARGFDMEVHYFSTSQKSSNIEEGAIFHESLDSLLEVSQFLSLHCPSTPQTKGIMSAEKFSKLPDGAIFINAARGDLVDEEALISALKSGKLAAAGLDCFRQEPGGNPELAELENVFMLPHIGSATVETRDAMGFRALDNIDAFFGNKKPGDRVA